RGPHQPRRRAGLPGLPACRSKAQAWQRYACDGASQASGLLVQLYIAVAEMMGQQLNHWQTRQSRLSFMEAFGMDVRDSAGVVHVGRTLPCVHVAEGIVKTMRTTKFKIGAALLLTAGL